MFRIFRRLSSSYKTDGNFVDIVRIRVRGGSGGNGAPSFEHDSWSPRGRPSGGDGGLGGNVVFLGDTSMGSLNHIGRLVIGERGGNGGRNMRHGKVGQDVVVRVPIGTEIKEVFEDEEADFVMIKGYEEGENIQLGKDEMELGDEEMEMEVGEEEIDFSPESVEAPSQRIIAEISISNVADPPVIVARGGRGGRGNASFGSNNHYYEKGFHGEERILEINLKTIADVGLVGLPNAGKSSFLTAVSNAHPRVAPFPFTTMNPYVGVIEFQDQSRVTVADIPGLIEGAHLNKGLGHQFLKHIVKSRILAMVVDFSNPEPWEDIKVLWRELDLFQEGLADKCKLVIANKADLLDGPTLIARINDTKTNLSILYNIPAIEILPVSALHGLAVTKVTTRLGQLINT